MRLRSKIAEIRQRMDAEGKIRQLTDAEMTQLHQEISESMRRYRQELARKEAQSIEDTNRIVLNA